MVAGLAGPIKVNVLAVPEPLNKIAPVLVLAVPSVNALAPWIAAVPVKTAALDIVWELIVLEVLMVVMLLNAPALVTSASIAIVSAAVNVADAVRRLPISKRV